ncbi:hypothetical protein K8I61_17860, partial [bacterium]|nr:hypothetical protein [bacterium]
MLLRHVIPGLIKLALVVIAPGYIVGWAARALHGRTAWATLDRLLIGLFVAIEAIILIDKGLPFFAGNVYEMLSFAPNVAVHLVVGAAGDAAWFILTRRTARRVAGPAA